MTATVVTTSAALSNKTSGWSSWCRAMSRAHRGRLSLPLKNRNSASGQYGRVEASGKRRDETRVAPPRSHRMIAAEERWALYGVVVTVSWVREADEASIGWLMVWWGCGGG